MCVRARACGLRGQIGSRSKSAGQPHPFDVQRSKIKEAGSMRRRKDSCTVLPLGRCCCVCCVLCGVWECAWVGVRGCVLLCLGWRACVHECMLLERGARTPRRRGGSGRLAAGCLYFDVTPRTANGPWLHVSRGQIDVAGRSRRTSVRIRKEWTKLPDWTKLWTKR